MTRVVADTNIFISALMFDGLPGVFLDLALARAFTLISSPALLDELDDTLCAKFAVSGEDLRLIRAKWKASFPWLTPASVCRSLLTILMTIGFWNARLQEKRIAS